MKIPNPFNAPRAILEYFSLLERAPAEDRRWLEENQGALFNQTTAAKKEADQAFAWFQYSLEENPKFAEALEKWGRSRDTYERELENFKALGRQITARNSDIKPNQVRRGNILLAQKLGMLSEATSLVLDCVQSAKSSQPMPADRNNGPIGMHIPDQLASQQGLIAHSRSRLHRRVYYAFQMK